MLNIIYVVLIYTMHIYGIKVLFAQYYAKRSFYAGFLDIKVIGINLVFTLSILNMTHIYIEKRCFFRCIYMLNIIHYVLRITVIKSQMSAIYAVYINMLNLRFMPDLGIYNWYIWHKT